MLSPFGIYFKFAYFLVKIRLFGGERVPKICFSLESSFLCQLGAHTKFCSPMTTLSMVYNINGKEEGRRKKDPKLWPPLL